MKVVFDNSVLAAEVIISLHHNQVKKDCVEQIGENDYPNNELSKPVA